jgi:hypothetical protein
MDKSIFNNMEVTAARRDESYPFFIEVYWNERGEDEDGQEVQRIEGYGYDDEEKFHASLDELTKGRWKGHVEKLVIHYYRV